MRRALVIEDAPEYQLIIRSALTEGALGDERFETTCAISADEALQALQQSEFDLILLDVGLPGRDGLSLCEELRRDPRWQTIPILFVTGRNEASDVVQGFAAGADDYVRKPFFPEELRARVEARLKRTGSMIARDHFWKADLHFSGGRQRVAFRTLGVERDLELTPNEFKILYFLAKHDGRSKSRAEILKEVWGENLHVVERTVDKHVCSLRRKMGDAAGHVLSVPGEGYMFRSVPQASPGMPQSTRSHFSDIAP